MKNIIQESPDEKIKQESTKDLANIHNFISSISLGGNLNMSIFQLMTKLQYELEKRPEAKGYLNNMKELYLSNFNK